MYTDCQIEVKSTGHASLTLKYGGRESSTHVNEIKLVQMDKTQEN